MATPMVEANAGAEPPPPAGATDADGRRWIVLGVLCLALVVVGIDGTIVNVALPTLVRELGATSSQLQWIVDAYTIVFAAFLLIAGNTGDRLGRKRCFILGLIIFGAGSLACSQVGSPPALIGFRAVQGFGAAFIMPATLSIIANVFTDEAERARAIALWAGVSGLGVAIGPLAGGYLLEHFWWGAIFLVNVPVVIATVAAALVLVPESRDPAAPPLDLLGCALSTVGLVALLYGIIEGPARGWTDPVVVASFTVAVVLLAAFVLWERRTDHPLLDIGFFSNPRFTAASVAVTLVFFAMFGSVFFVSQYLQFVLGYTALRSGAALLPVAATLMITAPLSAKLVARFGTKVIVTIGLVLVAVGLLTFSLATTTSGYPLVALVLVIIGMGMGLAMAPATDSIMGSLPPEKAGVGSAMNDTTREIGGALGVAILGSITAAVYSARIVSDPQFATLKAASPEAAAAVKDSVGAAAEVAARVPEAAGRLIVAASNDAFVHAMDRTVVVGAAVALLGALVAAVFLPARARAGDAVGSLVDGAARRLPEDPERRLGLARATLGLLADAGMSSLTYNAVAARSGIGTATLEHYWGSRVDAVTDAMAEVFRAHPVPDTGDLRRDLCDYVSDIGRMLSDPRAREVLGALIAEASRDPELSHALRQRVGEPRRREIAARLRADGPQLTVPVEVAIDLLVGPVYHRTLVVDDGPLDPALVDAVVDAVVAPD
ncbi:MAG TPA: DHA2 family efflux MFS transporter permease subunit [Acidimicrobiales bacterium]|nr:DHA2 family efflux MFS transporter permease subunit [Acidimicrobiales bacterium]